MRKSQIFLLLAALLLLGGCSSMERSYLYTEQHDERYDEDQESSALSVENYYGLKNAILSFVESGTEEGVIRSYSYDGDIESDLETAAYEITRSDPVGAYAVDYMTHDCNKIVSYYEITISLTLRRTPEEIASIVRVSGTTEAEEKILEAVRNGEAGLTLRMSYLEDLDVQQILEDACREDPVLAIGDAQATVQLYPESGVQRIVELSFSYDTDTEELLRRREAAEEKLDTLSRFVSTSLSEKTRAYILFRRVCVDCEYDPEDGLGDLYTSLVEGRSGSRGIAEAFYALCSRAGLDCSLITGRKQGESYWWNQLTLNGQTYHVDLSAAIEAGTSQIALLYDEDIFSEYSWDSSLYPACPKPEEAEEETPEAESEKAAPEAEETSSESAAPEAEEASSEETGPETEEASSGEPAAEPAEESAPLAADTGAETEAVEAEAAETEKTADFAENSEKSS